jgi:hypothetical protein
MRHIIITRARLDISVSDPDPILTPLDHISILLHLEILDLLIIIHMSRFLKPVLVIPIIILRFLKPVLVIPIIIRHSIMSIIILLIITSTVILHLWTSVTILIIMQVD